MPARRFSTIFLLIAVLCSVNCCYLAKQGWYVAKYSSRSEKIEKILSSSAADTAQARFLREVLAIKKYAVEKIGLAANGNYSTHVKVDKNYLIDVVAACRPDTFRQYQWWYPFFGRAPYKGYFVRKDAIAEAKRLGKKGYDVTVGGVDAFSSLGLIKDPVYSFMSALSPYELARLIIHEQTHATVFLKNQINFNEEAATFVGNQGAFCYIRERYGDTSAEYRDALEEKHDEEVWQTRLRGLYDSLAAVYAQRVPRQEKLERKKAIIAAFKTTMTNEYANIFRTGRYKGVQKADVNNAYLTIRMNYYKDESLYYELYKKCNEDLAATVSLLKSLKQKKPRDPKGYIKESLLGSS